MTTNIKLGDVLRMGSWPFADVVVIRIGENQSATFARPFAYASEYSRQPLMACELIEDVPESQWQHYPKVGYGRIR